MIHICYVINKNYIGQFKVSALSLLINTKEIVTFHILQSDLKSEDKDDLNSFLGKYNSTVQFYELSDEVFAGLPKMSQDQSYTAYYKVLIPNVLSNLDKVLFLDADIIINGDIKELYHLDTNQKFISCVLDKKINKKRKKHVLKINGRENTYFNSGVMLFDFRYKEHMKTETEIKSFIEKHFNDIIWHDQDILNGLYWEDANLISENYNFSSMPRRGIDIFLPKKAKALIIHYMNWKPWNSNYLGKFYRLYKKYYKMICKEEQLHFLKARNPFACLKLILKYIF